MLQRVHELRSTGASFALETTLATRSYVPFIRAAQAEGYTAHITYLSLVSVDLAVARVQARVRRGGHDVHPDIVARRFNRGLASFFGLYMPLANSWTLYDNSSIAPALVAHGTRGSEAVIVDATRFIQIRALAASDA